MLVNIKMSIAINIQFVKKVKENISKIIEVMKMVAIAAKKKAAIVLSEEEKLHLTNIARLHETDSVRNRADILLRLGETDSQSLVKAGIVSKSYVYNIKKEWENCELTGDARIHKIFSKNIKNSGRKKNDTTLQNRIDNVLQFNRRLNPDATRNTRSVLIAEKMNEQGIKISPRTVNRFLEQHEKQLVNI